MPAMRHPTPDPPQETGTRDGLAYALFAPPGAPRGGVVVLHGAGSRKENHFGFARAARAVGLAAVVFDQRGHGASEGALDRRIADDVATVAGVLPAGVPRALRGSSMGGYVALVAAERVGASAVVAICPAGAGHLLRGLREERFEFRADRPSLEGFLREHGLDTVVGGLQAELLLLHAEGDERIDPAHSRALLQAARAPRKKLIVAPGGHHRSVQHDDELQGESLRFVLRALRRRR